MGDKRLEKVMKMNLQLTTQSVERCTRIRQALMAIELECKIHT